MGGFAALGEKWGMALHNRAKAALRHLTKLSSLFRNRLELRGGVPGEGCGTPPPFFGETTLRVAGAHDLSDFWFSVFFREALWGAGGGPPGTAGFGIKGGTDFDGL